MQTPLIGQVASVAVGRLNGEAFLARDYLEDSAADTDMNVVMDEKGRFIEIQGTAEGVPFDEKQLEKMIAIAKKGIQELIDLQQKARLAPGN